MTDIIQLIQNLEVSRTAAMVANDGQKLADLLNADVLYSHSTGLVDRKSAMLERLSSGQLNYLSITPEIDHAVWIDERTIVGCGWLTTNVEVMGALKSLHARYMVVWRLTDEVWTLLALQG